MEVDVNLSKFREMLEENTMNHVVMELPKLAMGSLNQLLQWSILNSATASEDAPKLSDDEKKNITPQKFDPELLEAILGKDDATIMKEKMEVIRDTTQPTEDRETCFDDLEMLVEQIDNACNLEPLRMWPTLIELLADAEPSIRMNAAWVCGTAVQNNPKAQLAFLNASGLPVLLKMLRTENDVSVRAKLMYSLAGLIKHFVAGFMAFEMQGGWDVLKFTLRGDEAPVVRRKTLFLLNTLAVDNLTAAESEITHGFVPMLVQLVESAGRAAELDIEEATLSLQALLTLYANGQLQGKMNLSDDLRRQLSTSFAKLKADIADSFAAEELDTINRMCNAV